jgi:hypothetical protein
MHPGESDLLSVKGICYKELITGDIERGYRICNGVTDVTVQIQSCTIKKYYQSLLSTTRRLVLVACTAEYYPLHPLHLLHFFKEA